MRRMNRRLLRYLIPALALAAGALAVRCGPSLWRDYTAALSRRSAPLYAPRERMAGGNEPPAPRVAPELEQLEPAALELAARYAAEHQSRALIVARHDHIVFERYFDGSGFETVTDSQMFTPLLGALATGVAISHRRIGWPEEPLGLLLTEWRSDPRGQITVGNLLAQSSGLAPEGGLDAVEDLRQAVLSLPAAGPPGATRLEQAADPQLLALALERATGVPYAGYLSTTLWRRLGAADAWWWLDHPGGMPHAACCLFARQGDWIRVGQMMASEGTYRGVQVIRPGWVSYLRTPSKGDPDFGRFVRIASTPDTGGEPYAARDSYRISGRGGHRLWIVPSLGLVILCTGPAQGRDAQWEDSRIPNLVIRAARDFTPPPVQPGAALSTIVPGH